jgi:ferredoxin
MHAELLNSLREHYSLHPIGFPRTHSGAEMRVLERLFNDEEAHMALHLSPSPETPDSLSTKLGQDADKLQKLLDGMAQKGLVLKGRSRNNFRMVPFLPGIYEFQLNAMDKDMAVLFDDLYPELAAEIFSSHTAFTRVLAVEQHLPFDLEVAPYERASDIVKNAGRVALAECICRKEKKLLGKGCARPRDVCLIFSPMAEQYMDLGLGQEVSLEEALKAIDRGENSGLVRCSLNVQSRPTFMCQCCSCCCALLRGTTEMDIPGSVMKSGFGPDIDWDSCNGCEACLSICPMDAIAMQDEKAELNDARCIGCGLCVSECPLDAIALEARPQQEVAAPPGNFVELMTIIGKEKGRTHFYP